MLGENNQNEVEQPWAEAQGGGRIGTPFSEEILGVPYGLPSRLSRLAEIPWYHCYEIIVDSRLSWIQFLHSMSLMRGLVDVRARSRGSGPEQSSS